MVKPRISMIAVIGKNRELGNKNKLLWHLPEDLKYFHQVTTGHPVIMGLNTYHSIGDKPLKNRQNIILSRSRSEVNCCDVATSVEQAIETAKSYDQDEVFIVGGASVFAQGIEFADRLYLTQVDQTIEADTYFPEYSEFRLIEKRGSGETDNIKYEFNIYEK